MEFRSYDGYRTAVRYARAADRILARACGRNAVRLLDGPAQARTIRAALKSSVPKPGREADYAMASDLAIHACELLEAMDFRYVKLSAAPDGSVRLRECILFREGAKALSRDSEAWRLPVSGRADGRDVAVLHGTYDSARDGRALSEAAAVRVSKVRIGLRSFWIRSSVLEKRKAPGSGKGADPDA